MKMSAAALELIRNRHKNRKPVGDKDILQLFLELNKEEEE